MKALILAAVGTAFLATGCQANPYPVVDAGAGPVQTVQYWGDDGYDVPPRRYYYRRPPPAYYDPPAYGYYGPPGGYYAPRGYYYDRKAAKEYTKDYRRAQKEIFKDQVRGWNRANGF